MSNWRGKAEKWTTKNPKNSTINCLENVVDIAGKWWWFFLGGNDEGEKPWKACGAIV